MRSRKKARRSNSGGASPQAIIDFCSAWIWAGGYLRFSSWSRKRRVSLRERTTTGGGEPVEGGPRRLAAGADGGGGRRAGRGEPAEGGELREERRDEGLKRGDGSLLGGSRDGGEAEGGEADSQQDGDEAADDPRHDQEHSTSERQVPRLARPIPIATSTLARSNVWVRGSLAKSAERSTPKIGEVGQKPARVLGRCRLRSQRLTMKLKPATTIP